MGLTQENFEDRVYITKNSDNSAATGLTVTCVIINPSGTRISGTVVEMGNGWYKVTDFTPDADGTWCTEWGVSGSYTIHYPYKEFKVGNGQEAFILADTNEIQAELADGGRTDLLIDGIKAKTDLIGASVAPSGEYDSELTAIQADLDSPSQYKADVTNLDVAVSSRAPSGEYDTELDANMSTRAPASEYDTEMARITASVATEAKQDVIDGFHDVPSQDAVANSQIRDVVGNKTDTTGGDSLVALVKAVKTSTDNLPSDPADDSDIDTQLTTITNYVDLIDDGTDGLAAIKAEVEGIGGITPATQANVSTEVDEQIGDYAGQTNLQTLLASLGIPDVTGKPLYTCLVTDRLDHGTYGLNALDTDLGTLLTRLSATRAGYLDELDFDLQGTLTTIDNFVDDLEGRLTAVRAGYLDELDFGLAEYLEDLRQKATAPSWNQDTDSLEAISEAVAGLNDLAQSDILDDATPFSGADVTAILEDTGTTLPTTLSTMDGKLDTITTESQSHPTLAEIEAGDMASILADTEELQTDWADGGRLDLLLDAVPTTTEAEGYVENATDSTEGTSPHAVTTANDTSETQIIEIQKTGIYDLRASFHMDTLDTAGEGGTVTLRLYNKIDSAYPTEPDAEISYAVNGESEKPSFSERLLHDYTKITIQCSADVTATRNVPFEVITRDLGV